MNQPDQKQVLNRIERLRRATAATLALVMVALVGMTVWVLVTTINDDHTIQRNQQTIIHAITADRHEDERIAQHLGIPAETTTTTR